MQTLILDCGIFAYKVSMGHFIYFLDMLKIFIL